MKISSSLHEREKTFDELSNEEVERLIPLVVCLSFICISGAFGNSLAYNVYKTKYSPTNYRSFALCLSTIDFFSNVAVTPIEISSALKLYKLSLETLGRCPYS